MIARSLTFRRLADAPLSRVAYTGDLERDLQAFVEAYLETNETYGDIVAVILIELPRNPDLRDLIRTPWNNLQGALHLIERYQKEGRLKSEPPLAALGALVGPIMITQMFRRASPQLRVPPVDARSHVASFLTGRRVPAHSP